MTKIKKELQGEFTEKEIIEARDAICTKLIKKDNRNSGDEPTVDEEPPPHASKLGGKMKTSTELGVIRKEFISTYSWMFEGLESLKDELQKGQEEIKDDTILEELSRELLRRKEKV